MQSSNIFPINWSNLVGANAVYSLGDKQAFFGHYTFMHTQDRVGFISSVRINIPKPDNGHLFREINIGQQFAQFGPNNWALDLWRQHYNEWIRRSLYSFGEDDTFVRAYDRTRNAAGQHYEPQTYTDLDKTSHTDGGYRLYSARARVNYQANWVITDPAAAALNPQNNVFVPGGQIVGRYFTWFLDHVKMNDTNADVLQLDFWGNNANLVDNTLEAMRPQPVINLVEVGYSDTAAFNFSNLQVHNDIIAYNPGDDFAENPANTHTPDLGVTAPGAALGTPYVFTSSVEGNHKQRLGEMGNYFVLELGPTSAESQIERDPANNRLIFRNTYWNFEAGRAMYLMFNNYGYNLDNVRQHNGTAVANGADWSNHDKPLPLCFAFRSEQATSRLDITVQGHYEMQMVIDYADLHAYTRPAPPAAPVNADFATFEATLPAILRCAWDANVTERLVPIANHNGDAAGLAANCEFEKLGVCPRACLYIAGRKHNEEFMSDNYRDIQADSISRGLVYRAKNRISQHLCAPILNPDMRLGCIAPLNHDTRHLPPEMRDFVLRMSDVDFGFLETTEPVTLNDIVLSEFNGGVQDIATSESLLYLPNFKEYTTSVLADHTFSVDCYSGTGVPAFVCLFCRSGPVLEDQPLITKLSLQNRTTMKKSDTVFETDIHELFHMSSATCTTARSTSTRRSTSARPSCSRARTSGSWAWTRPTTTNPRSGS